MTTLILSQELAIFKGIISFRWFALKPKPGKKDEKYRGELEVKLTFIVQNLSGSLTSLSKQKNKRERSGSILNLSSVGK